MKSHLAIVLLSIVAVTGLRHVEAQRREPAPIVARTPWGDPDLQGTWDFTTITPLQRPAEFAGREFLTDSEAAAIEKQINQQRFETEERSPGSLGAAGRPESDPGIYNLGWWWEPNGRKLVRTRRTSIVVDPPDGCRRSRRRRRPSRARVMQRVTCGAPRTTCRWPNAASWASIPARRWCRDRTTISFNSFRVQVSS